MRITEIVSVKLEHKWHKEPNMADPGKNLSLVLHTDAFVLKHQLFLISSTFVNILIMNELTDMCIC